MSIFDIPDEVLFEMMDSERDFDEYPLYPPPIYEHKKSLQTYTKSTTKNTQVCRECGFSNLKWKETSFGWRLAYKEGPLTDKIHACEHELG